MNILLITDDDPVDSWVACQIAQHFQITQIIIPTDSTGQTPSHIAKKLLTAPLKSLSAIPRELMLQQIEQQREQFMLQQLWHGQAPEISPELAPIREVPIDQFNSAENAAEIQHLSPDLLIACGGPLLTKTIFEMPRLGSLNVQFGISDAYRGQHTLFWPLSRADWDHVGATIHKIDSGVNTGEILAQVKPTLTSEDTEFSVEVKVAQAILQSMLELLSCLKDQAPVQSIQGRVRTGQGQHFLYRDRTPIQEIRHRLKAPFRALPTPAKDGQRRHDWSFL